MADENRDWRPLNLAPRDGTSILLAVSPHITYERPGFICMGRWISPPSIEGYGKKCRQLYEEYGGWWATGKGHSPFSSPVWGWMPVPSFDFDAHRELLEMEGPKYGR
jgi:hypothetical protein